MLNSIKQRWDAVLKRYSGKESYWKLTPEQIALHGVLVSMIAHHAQGKVLDLGAGKLVYKNFLQEKGNTYISMDATPTHPDLNLVGTGEKIPLPDESLDAVFCSQVLEHAENTKGILREVHRVLKGNGCLILSVPHLSFLHDEPKDYFRFTVHGVRLLLKQAGFDVHEIHPTGGFLTFFTTPFFMALSAVLAPLWGVGSLWVDHLCGALGAAVIWIDNLSGANRHIFAVDCVALAFKPTPRGSI
jgi:SAM-dependent methyltransferase